MSEDRAIVPCGGCRLCCINDMIILHPEDGDDVASYDAVACKHPLTGQPAAMLRHKANGECIYLGPGGCTIHDRAPVVCRRYDCRRQYLRFTRAQRKALIARGLMTKEKFDAGRRRLATLGTDR